MNMFRILLSTFLIGIVLVGAWSYRTLLLAKAEAPPAQLSAEPYTLILSKEVAHPGEQLNLTVEGKNKDHVLRGIDSALEHWDVKTWTPKFVLLTDSSPSSHSFPLPPDIVIRSVGLTGPGPEVIELPSELPPGWYRIRKTIIVEEPGLNKEYTLYARLQVRL